MTAGDKESVAILACAESCGYMIKNQDDPGIIQCVGTLVKAWRSEDGPSLVRQALTIIKECWPDDRDGINAASVSGMISFLRHYLAAADPSRLRMVMRRVAAGDLMAFVKIQKRIGGSNSAAGWFREGLVIAYNKGLRVKSKRLTPITVNSPEELTERN